MSFRRYSGYQVVGRDWLDKVPLGWAVAPLKRSARLVTERAESTNRPVALEHIESWTGALVDSEAEFEGTGVRFAAGDVLYGKLRPYLAKAHAAAFAGEAVGDFHVLRPGGQLLGRYLTYLLLTQEVVALLNGSTYGAKMPRVSWDYLGGLLTPLPSPEEQARIVQFLDRETARIDALIQEQQRLIELLKEKRQAVISHAVTKGLDPTAPMKDSGVEWLGEVPAHWEVAPFKRIVATPITDGPHETPQFVDEGIPFISAEAISSGQIDFSKARAHITKEDNERYSLKYQPQLLDIYMVKSGATTGTTAIVETDLIFNIWSPIAVIRCGIGAYPYFILNFMRSRNFQEGVMINWSFGTQQNIGMKVIENLACVLPPLDEQQEIVKFLGEQAEPFSELIEQAKAGIALLQERRSALISAAVTGKIDVRGPVPTPSHIEAA